MRPAAGRPKTVLHDVTPSQTTVKAFFVRIRLHKYMPVFIPRPGSQSASRALERPIPDIASFDTLVRKLVRSNPLGCTPYFSMRKNYPPVKAVREMYTAKFAYTTLSGKRIGTSSEVYDSVEGYETGVAAMISNVANISAHRGKIRHRKEADLFSAILKCHDPDDGIYFVSLARNRITVSSYTRDATRKKVEAWADSLPELL
ncbi:hypothetical protein [Methanoregula sp.]|uniref:hypothetical protein n=1 Tax=Methanoregula sp. TaxID=2052170 RepID=UPI002CB25B15|nr:hypothetical protein [Methanoregula sp.]HVP97542.1 hypothetical protein [Methanoregula sp.]